MNNSTCVARYEVDDYYCACAPGISGKNCSDIGDDHITYRNNVFFGNSTSFDQAPSWYKRLNIVVFVFFIVVVSTDIMNINLNRIQRKNQRCKT